MPESKTKCPECSSFDVLIGTAEEPNHCSDCDHEWNNKPAAVAAEHSVIGFKAPSILMTIHQTFRRKRTVFEARLDKALKNIRG